MSVFEYSSKDVFAICLAINVFVCKFQGMGGVHVCGHMSGQ